MVPVTMDREIFYSLNEERLGWACMEPMFMKIRGKAPEVKNEVISQLGEGQKALCMFRILYDHSHKSAEEYYGWSCYLLDQPGYWNSVLEGVQFFGDLPLKDLLDETRQSLEAGIHRLGLSWGSAAITDLDDDAELREAVSGLYTQFQEVTAESLRNIAGYIRMHPEEFVVFIDGQA